MRRIASLKPAQCFILFVTEVETMEMQQTIHPLDQLMARQHAFFRSGATRSHAFRHTQLRRLRQAMQAYEGRLLGALRADLHKPEVEGYLGEIYFTYAEIDFMQGHLKSWMKPRRVPTPLIGQPSASRILHEPYGQTLIISPWNYPVQLLLAPLVASMAAGNCAVVKPSELAPATSQVITELLTATFPSEYIAAVEGDAEVAQQLLARRWDYIFFTGSTAVGRIVAQAAAQHLTPVTLELGGKSPAIVDCDAKLDVTARRIVWGKFYNAGQTCVAPDYLLVHESVQAALVEKIQQQLIAALGTDPAATPDYARIISDRHFDRLVKLMQAGRVVLGGESDRATRYIAPTLLEGVPLTAPVMQEEIFGPILPILTFGTLDEAIATVQQFARPLALYFFSESKATQERVTRELSFGGGCINDTLLHLANPHLPFGGVGESGQGAYHGRYGFETFSHRKSIVSTPTWIDLPLRYAPYKGKFELLKRLFK